MIKASAMFVLLAIALVGFAYGAYYHSRFIKAGGQRGFVIVVPALQTNDMRFAYQRMSRGYGFFIGAGAFMGFIAAVWGPVVI
jgi:ABC-type multidrug transport system permease subunit